EGTWLDAIRGRGRDVARAPRRRRRRDRERADGALPPARDHRRGRTASGPGAGLSRRLHRRFRGQGGAGGEPVRARLRNAARPPRWQRARGRGGERARRDAGERVTPWLALVGIGEDGFDALSGAARALIRDAEVLVGGQRHLALVPRSGAERLAWESPLAG